MTVINVFAKTGFTDIWEPYLYDWGGAEANSFRITTYEELRALEEIPGGPLLFADIERLTRSDRAFCAELIDRVRAVRPDVPILNDPSRAMRRYALLTTLYAKSCNPFTVYRLSETTEPARFPVFLRYEDDHTGATTGLLADQQALDRAIVRARIRGHRLNELLMVEFVDTSIEGRFFKYGAFRVGDRVIGRHAHRGTDWLIKAGNASHDREAEEFELRYVVDNPHAEALEERFRIGGIEYGRIDYAILDGSIVTWEINTNPIIILTRAEQHPSSLPRQEVFLPRLAEAFSRIAGAVESSEPLWIGNLDRARDARPVVSDRHNVRSFLRRHKRIFEPAVRAAEVASVPFERRILERWRRSNGLT